MTLERITVEQQARTGDRRGRAMTVEGQGAGPPARRPQDALEERQDSLEERHPGAYAERPGRIPPRGWWQVVRRGLGEFNADQMSLIAAGVAFKAFLSLVPALIAAILLYGLVVDPSQVERQVNSMTGVLPGSAQDLLSNELHNLVSENHKKLGVGLVVSLLLALWSASGGVGNLVQAVNDAYDEVETRSWVKRKVLAVGLTVGAIAVFTLTAALVAVFPAVENALRPPTTVRIGLEAARWLVVLVILGVSLALIYRVAPDRDSPRLRWVSVGAAVATVVWIALSVGFSVYVDRFASYDKTYGSLAGVVVLLLWIWLSLCAVLLGAEINAESEKQTVRDTTVGEPVPQGQREALKADLGPDDPEPRDADRRPADQARPADQGSGTGG
ncbi:MAG TPA: YihY/virulence factor BrkB family protein [Kineosporiaceae bacterium]